MNEINSVPVVEVTPTETVEEVVDIQPIDGYAMLAQIKDEISRTPLIEVTKRVEAGCPIAHIHLRMLNREIDEEEEEREKELKELEAAIKP